MSHSFPRDSRSAAKASFAVAGLAHRGTRHRSTIVTQITTCSRYRKLLASVTHDCFRLSSIVDARLQKYALVMDMRARIRRGFPETPECLCFSRFPSSAGGACLVVSIVIRLIRGTPLSRVKKRIKCLSTSLMWEQTPCIPSPYKPLKDEKTYHAMLYRGGVCVSRTDTRTQKRTHAHTHGSFFLLPQYDIKEAHTHLTFVKLMLLYEHRHRPADSRRLAGHSGPRDDGRV